jgi:hypothetical protein
MEHVMRLIQNNWLTHSFAIPKIRRFVSFTQLEIFRQRKFWNRDEKLSRNVGAIFFKNIEKSDMCTITWDTHESGNKHTCEFQPDIQKFLVAFSNENLFGYPAAKGHFLGMSAYLKISGQSQLRFLQRPSYRKINKGWRADSCEADE